MTIPEVNHRPNPPIPVDKPSTRPIAPKRWVTKPDRVMVETYPIPQRKKEITSPNKPRPAGSTEKR